VEVENNTVDSQKGEEEEMGVLSGNALEAYFEKLFFDYQQELFLSMPETMPNSRYVKNQGYIVDEGIDSREDNYFAFHQSCVPANNCH
jgi:hypothetical protein